MSAPTDAVWIVKELLEEIIGMAHFRKVEEEIEAKKGDVKSEVKEEHDWVKLIEAEKQEMIGKDNCEVVKPVDMDATPVECDFCFDKCICEEIYAEMKEWIGKCFSEEVGGNVETIVCEEVDEGMKEVISDEENVNRKDIVIEKKEEKFPEYKTMGFNWKEVDPIFKG